MFYVWVFWTVSLPGAVITWLAQILVLTFYLKFGFGKKKKKSVAGTYKLQSSNFKTWTFLSKMKEHPLVTFWVTPGLLGFLLQPFYKIVHKNIILVNTNLHLIPLCYLLALPLIQRLLLRNNSMFTSLLCFLFATSASFENILSVSNKDASIPKYFVASPLRAMRLRDWEMGRLGMCVQTLSTTLEVWMPLCSYYFKLYNRQT